MQYGTRSSQLLSFPTHNKKVEVALSSYKDSQGVFHLKLSLDLKNAPAVILELRHDSKKYSFLWAKGWPASGTNAREACYVVNYRTSKTSMVNRYQEMVSL